MILCIYIYIYTHICCLNVFMFFYKLFMFLCFYMLFFDCKCNKLKKTRRKQNKQQETDNKQKNSKKHIQQHRNTGYPALDPTEKKYFSGSGWEIMIFVFFPSFICLKHVFMFFYKLFMFLCFYMLFVRL